MCYNTLDNFNRCDKFMKKFLSFILIIFLLSFIGCNNTSKFDIDATDNDMTSDITSDYNTSDITSVVITEPKYDFTIDYEDAKSFEKALNDGKKVNNKIVQFDVVEYKPDSALGINCWSGEQLNFISDSELDVRSGDIIIGQIIEEPTEFLGSWEILYKPLVIDGEQINTPSKPNNEAKPSEITVTMNADDFKGTNYKDAENKFRQMGFTKFEYKIVDTVEEKLFADTICYIEITESFFGNSNFEKGDKFVADSTVTFYYYSYEEPSKPSPVFYSTNDYETAKNGNSGVFSYKSKGASYDIYWIIDFDEGYVYTFTEGNDNLGCDRLKIQSGTLNDAITITYHDGGDFWSYKLHFKYKNSPETLIMVDQNGFDYKYTTTNLTDALSLRNTKKIIDY